MPGTTTSNFAFVAKHWPLIADLGIQAERLLYLDAHACVFKLRAFEEELIRTMLKVERVHPGELDLAGMIREYHNVRRVHPAMLDELHTLRKLANAKIHGTSASTSDATAGLQMAHTLVQWAAALYLPGIDVTGAFVPPVTPVNFEAALADKTAALQGAVAQVQALEAQFNAERDALKAKQAELEAQLLAQASGPGARVERDGRQAKADQAFDHLSEAETRLIIDRKLKEAGWDVKDQAQVALEFGIQIPQRGGVIAAETAAIYGGQNQFADYLLRGDDGKPLAIVEAKKAAKDANVGKEQALNYAKNVQKNHGGDLPFVMYTNAHDIHFWNYDYEPSRKVYGFPTREDLNRIRFLTKNRKPLKDIEISKTIVERSYQFGAIRTIAEGLTMKRRKFLLIMATGSGKTRTTVALLDLLMRAHWGQRVLFLVDRVALRDQALEAFKDFLPDAPIWPKTQGSVVETAFATNRRVYVATYPTMLHLITSEKASFSPHFFDVIVCDEVHRSLYNVFKDVFDYFDAYKIGLTATPTGRVDHNTFDLYGCQVGHPTYVYEYKKAVEEGFLATFAVQEVQTKFQQDGIKGVHLTDKQKKKLVDDGIDPESIDFEGSDLEKLVTNWGTNRAIIRQFMNDCIKDGTGTKPGKTIIFCVSIAHARQMEEIFNDLFPEFGGKLARVLVSEDVGVHGKGGLLDQFRTEDMPRIAISVDMLDTGVDVREVVNLVFAKPVFSWVKFWQMIGRGTRLLETDPARRKPWCTEKEQFVIFDCWKNFAYFDENPGGKVPPTVEPLPVKLFKGRLAVLEALIGKSGNPQAVARAMDAVKGDLAALPAKNVTVLDASANLAKLGKPEFWLNLDADGLAFLKTAIAPVMRARTQIEEKWMRFEISCVGLLEAWATVNQAGVEAARIRIVNQVKDLPLAVNVVATQKPLIDAVLGGGFWVNLTDDGILDLAAKLGPLMRFRQGPTDLPMVEVELLDTVVHNQQRLYGLENADLSTKAYREKIEAEIRLLLDQNAVLQKLAAGQPVSDEDIKALAEVLRLQEPHVTEELLRKVYDHKAARFIQFIRHILGLEILTPWKETVTKEFEAFIAHHNTFSAVQIAFLQTLKAHLIRQGRIEKKDLVGPPFTQIDPDGIRGLFQEPEIEAILLLALKVTA
jgi:type I restriction enzyme R subunit